MSAIKLLSQAYGATMDHVSGQRQKKTPTKEKSLLVGVISPKAVLANSIALAKAVAVCSLELLATETR
jgi:hypothetical protein